MGLPRDNWDKRGRIERGRRNGTVSMFIEGEKIIRKNKKKKQITPFNPKFGPLSKASEARIIVQIRRKTEAAQAKRRQLALKRANKHDANR